MARPRMVPMTPDQLDPLEAAAAPITVEPSVDPQAARNEAQVRLYMERGFSPEEARRLVAEEGGMFGPVGKARLAEQSTPAARESGRRAVAALRQTEGRQQAFEDNYNDATGGNDSRAQLDALRAPAQNAGDEFAGRIAAAQSQARREWSDYLRRQAAKLPTPGMFTAQAQKERAVYGDGLPKAEQLSANQLAAREQRNNIEERERQDPRRAEASLIRKARAAGISPEAYLETYPGAFPQLAGIDDAARGRLAEAAGRDASRKEREARWLSQMTLAGGRPTGGPIGTKATNAAFDKLDPSQQQEVIMARMTPRGAGDARGDNAIAMMEAKLRAEAAQRALDRDHDRGMQDDKTRADERRFESERLAREEQAKALQRQFEEKIALERSEAAARAEAARQSHEAQMAGLNAQLADILNRGKQSDAARALEQQKFDETTRQQKLGMQMQFQQHSPGLHAIMLGQPNTREAIQALKSIAADADNFDYLPGRGFGLREATSMNDKLLSLAKQAEQMGIDSPLSNPEYRRKLINDWGYNSGFYGGKGGWLGNFSRPMPAGL